MPCKPSSVRFSLVSLVAKLAVRTIISLGVFSRRRSCSGRQVSFSEPKSGFPPSPAPSTLHHVGFTTPLRCRRDFGVTPNFSPFSSVCGLSRRQKAYRLCGTIPIRVSALARRPRLEFERQMLSVTRSDGARTFLSAKGRAIVKVHSFGILMIPWLVVKEKTLSKKGLCGFFVATFLLLQFLILRAEESYRVETFSRFLIVGFDREDFFEERFSTFKVFFVHVDNP